MPHPWRDSRSSWMGLWEPGLVDGVPANGRRIGTRGLYISFQSNTFNFSIANFPSAKQKFKSGTYCFIILQTKKNPNRSTQNMGTGRILNTEIWIVGNKIKCFEKLTRQPVIFQNPKTWCVRKDDLLLTQKLYLPLWSFQCGFLVME